MARRNWDVLTETYRKRLSRSGVTREQYESGASLGKARGHAATPEHPREAARNPQRYPKYVAKKSEAMAPAKPKKQAPTSGTTLPPPTPPGRKLQNDVIALKDRFFGDRFKYDVENSIAYVRYGRKADDIPKPTAAQLQRALEMTEQEMEDAGSMANGENSEYKWARFMWYH